MVFGQQTVFEDSIQPESYRVLEIDFESSAHTILKNV